ncbi:MAG: hypothetical protein ACFE9S_09845 [Candidatus Hermodarchaeota archaeon]
MILVCFLLILGKALKNMLLILEFGCLFINNNIGEKISMKDPNILNRIKKIEDRLDRIEERISHIEHRIGRFPSPPLPKPDPIHPSGPPRPPGPPGPPPEPFRI